MNNSPSYFYEKGHRLHKEGNYSSAWDHWVTANGLYSGKFDILLANSIIDKIIDYQYRPLMDGDLGEDLVFIVGMPRSGTTLLERLINIHPNGHGSGELNTMVTIFDKFIFNENYSDNNILEARKLYRLSQPRREGKVLVDKMPRNFLGVGIIKTIFPNAKIIHSKRDMFSTCIGIYSSDFGDPMPWRYRLDTLQIHYRQYLKIVDHFKSILFTIRYEDIINDYRGEEKRLLEYLELSDFDCSAFYTDTRNVQTASKDQVNKPLNKLGLSKWDPYRQFVSFEEL
jgi:hypothetical protein